MQLVGDKQLPGGEEHIKAMIGHFKKSKLKIDFTTSPLM